MYYKYNNYYDGGIYMLFGKHIHSTKLLRKSNRRLRKTILFIYIQQIYFNIFYVPDNLLRPGEDIGIKVIFLILEELSV